MKLVKLKPKVGLILKKDFCIDLQIVFLKPASQELEDSFSWYEDRKPGLGQEFVEEIVYYLDLIKNNPFLFEKYEDKADLEGFHRYVFLS